MQYLPGRNLGVPGGYFIGQVHSIFLEQGEEDMVVIISGGEVQLSGQVLLLLGIEFLLVKEFDHLHDRDQQIDRSDNETNDRRDMNAIPDLVIKDELAHHPQHQRKVQHL